MRDADATMALYQRVKRTVSQGIAEAQVRTHDVLLWHCPCTGACSQFPHALQAERQRDPERELGPRLLAQMSRVLPAFDIMQEVTT